MRSRLSAIASVAVAICFPLVVTTPYIVRVLILAGIFMVLALSYDMIVGQVGSLSLAHPAFFGVGAYTVGLLVTKTSVGFFAAFLAGAALAGLVAILVGIPSFRLHERSFAIGTLGIALVLQLVANNWMALTNGPLCVAAIPPLAFTLPGGATFTTANLTGAYYSILVLALGTFIICWVVSRSRVGRAFHAIRENELLAEAQGINALFYKMFAFSLGAAIAGVAGGFYAMWARVVCPALMGLPYTITLLIIVFLGGRGSLRGIALAAILFTILPEVLRIGEFARLVIYGVVLLVFVVNVPQGLEGAIAGIGRLTSRHGGHPRQGNGTDASP